MAPRELDLALRAGGASVVREVLLEARVLDAQRLHQLGFLSRCIADSELAGTVLAAAPEHREGIAAFLDKRKPGF